MGLNDLVHITGADVAVPDGLRIYHNGRAVLALVKASSLVGADSAAEFGFGESGLKKALQIARS